MCGSSPFLLADTNFPPSPPFSVFDDTTFCLRVGTSLTRAVWVLEKKHWTPEPPPGTPFFLCDPLRPVGDAARPNRCTVSRRFFGSDELGFQSRVSFD